MKKLLLIALAVLPMYVFANNLTKSFPLSKNCTLTIEKGNITQCQVAAIVNAANEQLLGGAGVCGAIFNAAGWDALQSACNKYPEKNSIRCPVGQARITPAFNLTGRTIDYIIHAVGPDCRIIHGEEQQDFLLTQAYKNSLLLADQNNISSIAFPFISSAIYAFPKKRAALIALKTLSGYAQENQTKITNIHFVLFEQSDFDLLCSTMEEL